MRLLKQLKSSYNKRSGLPKGFTEVEYLESSANAYIRTDIYPTDEYGYKIFNTYTIGGGEQCAIGCMDSGNRFVGIYSAGSSNQLSGAWGSFVNFLSIPTTWDNDTIHSVECNYKNSRKIIWNNNELKDISDVHISGTISRPLVLFGRDSGSITGLKGKIYKVIITKGTEIVNVFIPCLDTENTPCMYDIINKQAYYNVGSGNFTYGKKIYGVEYLQSTGAEYIDTGITSNLNTTVEMDLNVVSYSTNNTATFFGGLASNIGISANISKTNTDRYSRFGTKYTVIKNLDIEGIKSKITIDKNAFVINGQSYAVEETSSFSGPNMYLFKGAGIDSAYNTTTDVYSCKLWDNDVLVRDFVPVKDENNIGYMYDKVTHKLFANTGTGTFVLGSEAEQWDNTSKIAFVEEYKGKLPRKYTEVEYLESTGTQYINTGLLSTAQSKVDVVFSFSSMESGTVNNCAVFGGRNNSTNTTFTFFKIASATPQYFRFDYNSQPQVATASDMTWNTSSKYHFQYDGTNGITTNTTTGESVVKAINPASTFTTNPICLFAVNTNTAINTNMSGRIYKYWYTDGTTTIDLIPVLDEMGKPCMYDRISGNAYYNQGTGDDFIAGPKIRQVEYLESTGTQYIDTGYAFADDFSWEIDFENITRGATLFGGRTSSVRTALLYQKSTTQGVETTCPIDNMTGDQTPFQLTDLSTNRHKVKMSVASNKGSVWVDDVQVYDEQSFTGAYISGTTQALFADNFGTSISEYTSSKVYSLKMWQGSSLVRDFIPVIDENNVGYMFDKVTHTLYTNAGTGSFAYGNLVRQYTLRLFRERDDIPTTYKKVSYLESTGTQYIDTGIAGSSTLKIEMIAQKAGSSLGVYFGAGTGNNRIQSVYINDYNSARIGNISNASIGPDNEKFDIICDTLNKSVIYNGTSFEFNYTTTLTNLNICIFARNEGDSYADKATAKCWSFKTWNNNILTRDFVPVIRKSDNKPGMYDRITRTFYTNAGSGEFNYGE